MALDINVVRLLERLADIAEKIAKDGVTFHHHHYEHEADPGKYAVHYFTPPTPGTGGKPQ